MPKRGTNQDESTSSRVKSKKARTLYMQSSDDESDEFDSGIESSHVTKSALHSSTKDSGIGSLVKTLSGSNSRLFDFDSSAPMAGVILRVSLCNFMCHNRLEVLFCSHVNFVIGRNGSGKSAIMTGLVVGLGGKAQITNRGGAIKDFVKKGKRSAWVEVCLSNKGKDAFKPDVYGEKIIIQRKFTVDGSSRYSIYNAMRKLITERKDELTRITDHMNIQVDNPVAILNQDMSRNFLNTKSSGDKFKFFMKATQLEQMNADYLAINQDKEHTEKIIQSKDQTIRKMTSDIKALERKCRNMRAISDLKTKVKDLKNEVAWAIVAENEKSLQQHRNTITSEEASIPKFKEKVDSTKKHYENIVAENKLTKEKLTQYAEEVKEMEPLLQERKKEMVLAKEKAATIQTKLRMCDRQKRSIIQDRRQCQERIEELKSIASHDFEAERKAREEKLKNLETRLQEQDSKQRVTEHELEQFRSAVAKLKSEIGALETQIRRKQSSMRDTKATLDTLKAARKDRLRRFGPMMPDIIQEINAKRLQFNLLPRGPLGSCFRLQDHKWALPVERCLQSLMTSFTVNDYHDEKILENIFLRCCHDRNRRPTIITSKFSERVHDVNRFRVKDSCYPCVLDVIQCDDAVVVNTLIDQRGIENVLLIENTDEARHVMMRRQPLNAKECFTKTGDQMFCKPIFREYSADVTTIRYLMANVEDQIAAHETELKASERAEAELVQKRHQLMQDINRNQQEAKKCQTQLNKVGENMNRLKFEISELKNVEDPDPVDVTTLEEEVKVCSQKIEELQKERESIHGQLQAAESALEESKNRFMEVEAEKREKSESGIPLQEKICDTQHNLDIAKRECKHYEDKLKELEKKIQVLNQQLLKKEQEFDSYRAKACEICEPISTQRTATSIENEITQIQKRIEEEQERHGNEEEILENYATKKGALSKIKRELENQKSYISKLVEVMTKRKKAYRIMREHIANRAKYHFLNQMYNRSFTGQMDFDFEREKLEISVTPSQDSQEPSSVVKDLKGLSGGERSFSTVCFILSLWEAMESPFRCLDEFDVFMDMVNRRISMDMMMETADMHKNLQFIFLTPQDMSVVRKIDNVKIIRMQDPERTNSQATLNFTQLSQESMSQS